MPLFDLCVVTSLAGGASIVVPHTLGKIPDVVWPDRATALQISAYSATSITVTNPDASTSHSATFTVARYHSLIRGLPANWTPQVWQGSDASSSSAEDVIDVTEAPYNVVPNVSTEAQSVLNRTGLQAADAAQLAAYVAGTPKRVVLPAGEIFVSYGRSYNLDPVEGRILIRTPGAVWQGAGETLTFIRGRSRKDSTGRRASFTDDTVSTGRRSSAAGNVITLGTGQAAAFVGFIGAEIYASPNSNGSSPRAQTDAVTVDGVNVGANTITLSDASEITLFANNDFIFIKNRLTLTVAADAANYSDPTGTTALSEVWASPNQDGSSPRTGAASVINVNASTGVLTLGAGAGTAISGFIDGDFLFVNVGFAVFEHRLANDANTGVVYDALMTDMTIDAEFYGGTDNPTITGEDPSGDMFTRCILANNSSGGNAAVAYTFRLERVTCSDGYTCINYSGGTTPATTLEMIRCKTSGGRAGVFMGSTDPYQGKTYKSEFCEYLPTDSVQGSPHLYISPLVSVRLVQPHFHGVPESKNCIQHQGTSTVASPLIIMGGIVEGIGNGFETNEHGGVSDFHGVHWFNGGEAIHIRTSVNIVGGRLRKRAGGTGDGFTSYSDCQFNAHIRITGTEIDFADAAYDGCVVATPSRWTLNGVTWTATNPNQQGGEPVPAAGSRCLSVQTGAFDAAQPPEVCMTGCIANFNTTTGTVEFLLIDVAANIDVVNCKWKGRTPTGDAAIRVTGGTINGSGRIRVASSVIDAYGGGCIKVDATFAGTPTLEIIDNWMITHAAGRDCIDLSYTNTCPTSIRGNRFNAADLAVTVAASVPAGDVSASENNHAAGAWSSAANKQSVRLRSAIKPTNTTAVAGTTPGTTLTGNFDTFPLADGGAITIDQFLIDGTAAAQLCHDSARITLIFTTGNITLGAGGNITERAALAGARAAGSAATLVYNAALTKWIEV